MNIGPPPNYRSSGAPVPKKCLRTMNKTPAKAFTPSVENKTSTRRKSTGRFYSILSHRTTLGGQLYAYGRFVPCGSEQISLNCIYATKHKVNTCDEYLIRSGDCVSVWS